MAQRKGKDRWETWVAGALRQKHLKEPPDGTLRKALALGGKLPGRAPAWRTLLTFDSAARPAPAGLRGAGAAERRLLYEATEAGPQANTYQIDLRIRRESEGSIEVTGQILPPWEEGRVEASLKRARRTESLGNAGQFLLRGLPRGGTKLRLEFHDKQGRTLVLAEVPLPTAES